MNVYQKNGTFLVRLVGAAMFAVAVVGLGYYALLSIQGTASSIPTSRFVSSVCWLVIGIVLLIVSKPLGKLLGAGLS